MSTSQVENTTDVSAIGEDEYDKVPYPGGAFPATHPSHLATVARLCHVESPEPDRCRVLELGCAMGSNLIPIADQFPNSEFVGIDLSAKQVDQGTAFIKQYGLKNITLHQKNIAELGDEFGKFDYIICHGVYSWVPPEVQRAILDIGKQLLTPQGVQYVSYNTLPGWHLRGVVRDMMQYHVRDLKTPSEQIGQARALLKFLTDSAQTHSEAYKEILKKEAETLAGRGDYYIYHEHLEANNEAIYFHEFAKRVDASGLRYLGDASFNTMLTRNFGEETHQILREGSLIQQEQYMDFLRARMFRCSLLCHPQQRPRYRFTSESIEPMHLRLQKPAEKKETSSEPDMTEWDCGRGDAISTNQQFTYVLERLMQAYPSWVSVRSVLENESTEQEHNDARDFLWALFIKQLARLSYKPMEFGTRVDEYPVCRPLARFQAQKNRDATNWMHQTYRMQPQQRLILQHADGSRSIDQLAEVLSAAVKDGKLIVSNDQGRVDEADTELFRQIVVNELWKLCALGFLQKQ